MLKFDGIWRERTVIKRVFAAFLTIFTLFFISGCRQSSKQASHDKLVGGFITTESIGKTNATLTAKTHTDPSTGKVSETREYVFNSINGISCIAAEVPATDTEDSFITAVSDEAVCGKYMSVNVGDNEGIDLKGSIYITPSIINRAYFINPVYQRQDGSVYVVPGSGTYIGKESCNKGAFSQKLHETNTVTKNGKEKSVYFNLDISISVMLPPAGIVVLQMDKNSAILSKQEYAPGNLPGSITPVEGTSYIILETHALDQEGKPAISYELYNEDSDSIKAFYCREDGICIEQHTALDWSKR